MGLTLNAEEIARLDARTEGWIAGLQLAALSLQGHQDVQSFVTAFAGSNHYVMDYLLEEVLQRQPEALQHFLLQTAILERLSAPLCDVVTGRNDSQSVLAQLQRSNLFLIPLDDERRWYRYHHLFAEVLQNRLRQNQTDQVNENHRRASHWYAANQLWAEAIHHLLAAHEFVAAAALVETQALDMALNHQFGLLQGWLQAMPSALQQSRPGLQMAAAWLAIGSGQVAGIERLFQQAEQLLVDDSTEAATTLRTELVAVRSLYAGFTQQHRQAIDFARQALALLRWLTRFRGWATSLKRTLSFHWGHS